MKKLAFNAVEIMQLLPHKYPFLLLDGVEEVVPGKTAVGYKNFTLNEWFFRGHFPDRPIVPGVLLIESMAQLVAMVYVSEGLALTNYNSKNLQAAANNVGYLVKSDIRFTSIVQPGAKLDMSATIIKKIGKLSRAQVKATVNKKIVAEGELTVSQQ